jgi:hypothetical protein
MKHVVVLLLAALTLNLGGCASIISGPSQTVQFSSNPSGIYLELVSPKGEVVHSGTTPFSASLRRGRGFFVASDLTIRAQHGGKTVEQPIQHNLNPWYIGNIVFGGLVGALIVDPLTGGMWAMRSTIHLDLTDPEQSKGLKKQKTAGLHDPPDGPHLVMRPMWQVAAVERSQRQLE